MWMRIAAALAVAGLAGLLVTCGGDVMAVVGDPGKGDTADTASPTPTPTASADGPGGGPLPTQAIACAPGGASSFDSTCTVERADIDGARLLTVFHPDGGFRRFEQLADGSGLAVVAGADELTQTLNGDTLEIAIAGNRYRFPATTQ